MLDVHHKGRAVVSSGSRGEGRARRVPPPRARAVGHDGTQQTRGCSTAAPVRSAPARALPLRLSPPRSATCCVRLPASSGSCSAPTTRAYAALFPPAYPDDPEHEAEYRRLMAETCCASARPPSTSWRPPSTPSGSTRRAHAWLGALNDLRLVLGTRLDVTEDDMRTRRRRPATPVFALYSYLGWLQERSSALADLVTRRAIEPWTSTTARAFLPSTTAACWPPSGRRPAPAVAGHPRRRRRGPGADHQPGAGVQGPQPRRDPRASVIALTDGFFGQWSRSTARSRSFTSPRPWSCCVDYYRQVGRRARRLGRLPGRHAAPSSRRTHRAPPAGYRPGRWPAPARRRWPRPCRRGTRSRAGSSARRPRRYRRCWRRVAVDHPAGDRAGGRALGDVEHEDEHDPTRYPARCARWPRPGCRSQRADVGPPAGMEMRGEIGRRERAEDVGDGDGESSQHCRQH